MTSRSGSASACASIKSWLFSSIIFSCHVDTHQTYMIYYTYHTSLIYYRVFRHLSRRKEKHDVLRSMDQTIALLFGLFPMIQWNISFFRGSDGNPTRNYKIQIERGISLDPNTKKQVLRTFTYGLYAVSCADEGEVNIFTANWLTQVSFDPPLLAVSVENDSKSLGMILRSRVFTVNVYRSEERNLAGQLGKSAIKLPDKRNGLQFA